MVVLEAILGKTSQSFAGAMVSLGYRGYVQGVQSRHRYARSSARRHLA